MQPINNLKARMKLYHGLLKRAVDRVIDSGYWILGPECNHFEQLFANYIAVDFCVGVANGTDAIELALKAMGITAGNLVATVANAGMYTTSSILAIGAIPFFMDVDMHSGCTTLSEVKTAIAAGVKTVVITALYGRIPPEIAEIADYCRQQRVLLLEDCAQAHGACLHSKRAGAFGDAATFSFYPTKNLGALGDGGAVVTPHAYIAEQVRLLRQYGWTSKYKVEIGGARNSRLDEMQAAILTELLPHLDEANEKRRQIAAYYTTNIKHPLVAKPLLGGEDYVAHLYIIRSRKRESLRQYLFNNQIASDIHYPIPDHRQPLLAKQFEQIILPNTEQLATEILTLPCYPEMSSVEVEHVVKTINGWLA